MFIASALTFGFVTLSQPINIEVKDFDDYMYKHQYQNFYLSNKDIKPSRIGVIKYDDKKKLLTRNYDE